MSVDNRDADRHPSNPENHLFTAPLFRIRRVPARAYIFSPTKPKTPIRKDRNRPPRVAYLLALAHELQSLIDSGDIPDRATLAHQLGLTRPRLTQLLDLLVLAPNIQEEILVEKSSRTTERLLRRLVRSSCWAEQRTIWNRILTYRRT